MAAFANESTALTTAPHTAASIASVLYHPTFARRHILSAKSFTREDLHALFSVATEMRVMVERQGSVDLLRGRVLASLFYEESTRTSCSFEAAMLRLGGQVVKIQPDKSSVQKGESIPDTIRTLGCYADAIVMRHPTAGSVHLAAKHSPVPVISGGESSIEHPTQALLDTFAIREEMGTVAGLTITMVGDLKYGRTVHSLVQLLCLYGVTVNYVSPESLKMPEDVKQSVARRGIKQYESTVLSDDILARTDVLYVTRVQKERFPDVASYEAVKDSYIIDNATLSKCKPTTIVLHPLPKNNELADDLEYDPRAAWWRQVKYGLYLRMALLAMVLHQRS